MKPVPIISTLVLCVTLNAGAAESHWTGRPDVSSHEQTFEVIDGTCTAVDSKGVRHHSKQKADMIWLRDLISSPAPEYYKADYSLLRESTAVFRLVLDPSTGNVRQVIVIRASEYTTLDSCAVKALRRWRWKPGKWKEIELPMWMSAYH